MAMIGLYAHNRAAYEAAVAMLDETGKAAIIHPTGTGKSFTALSSARITRTRPCAGFLPPLTYFKRKRKI